mmetsp:Transcript_14736/g.16263  ORF Transcript_14736/g.16263 Transcript_14736/m.16263 type:complete len:403 (+) Transcript_14736:95-1303(+)
MRLFLVLTLAAVSIQSAKSECKLCPGGKPFANNGQTELPLQSGKTCADLEENDECDEKYQFLCGCEDVEPNCSLCPDGTPVPNRFLVIPSGDFVSEDTTCGTFDALFSTYSDSTCAANQEEMKSIAAYCGCPNVESEKNCTTICSDGSFLDPAYRNVIVLEGDEPTTCSDLLFDMIMNDFTELECNSAYYFGVHKCGCNPPEDRTFCQICEDDSIIPDPTMQIGISTCYDGAGYGFMEDAGTDKCKQVQSVDGVYCKCKTGNPIASEGACRTCGGNTLLPNTQRKFVDKDFDQDVEFHCFDWEFFFNDPEVKNCGFSQTRAKEYPCCEGTEVVTSDGTPNMSGDYQTGGTTSSEDVRDPPLVEIGPLGDSSSEDNAQKMSGAFGIRFSASLFIMMLGFAVVV